MGRQWRPPGRLVWQAARETAFYKDRLAGPASRSPGSLREFSARASVTQSKGLVDEKLRTGDPYSGRLAAARQPLVSYQLDYSEETPLYLGLDASDLRRYAEALRRCLALLGVRHGDTIGIFDYGTSPVAYLASASYTPYLSTGAADALGCTTICNDGVATMSQRAVEILKYVGPRYFLVRVDCLQPLIAACEAQGIRASHYTEAVIATANEGALDPALRKRCEEGLGVPVFQMPRSDVALFIAVECPDCRLAHTWADLYVVEVSPDSLQPGREGQPGYLVITSRFARTCPALRLLTQLEGRLATGSCPRGPGDWRLWLG